MHVLSVVAPVEGQHLSPNKNKNNHMILNLKKFNQFTLYYHFKMGTFESAIQLIIQDTYAYLSTPLIWAVVYHFFPTLLPSVYRFTKIYLLLPHFHEFTDFPVIDESIDYDHSINMHNRIG